MPAKIAPRRDPEATGPRDWTEYEAARAAARKAPRKARAA